MKVVRPIAAVVLVALAAPVPAQEFAKPGPEHELLKKLEGTWDVVVKSGGVEEKGVVTYKMDLGGMWLAGTIRLENASGAKFEGRGFDSYDATKKVYRSLWIDSTSATVSVMEGPYDKQKKAFVKTGEAAGPDGKPVKMRSVFAVPDDNTCHFELFAGDAKEPVVTITYKRKK